MKIKPIILCGGAGTRLWPESKKNIPKQFIDFGGWTLFKKTLDRIKKPIFDSPIISTNLKYLNITKKYLLKYKVKNYTIVLEPLKKNPSPAIISSILINEISFNQPVIFFPADHIIENEKQFVKIIKDNIEQLDSNNILLFGINPTSPSSQYGYIIKKKFVKNIYKVDKFIEKPTTNKAKIIQKKGGLWNSGMFMAKKISIINNFKKHDPKTLKTIFNSFIRSKVKKNVYILDKYFFSKVKNISFDYAILEKSKNIFCLKVSLKWSDLGNWKEISNIFKNNKVKYFRKKNVFYRPWGSYTNLFYGKGFLIKELVVNENSSISLQKHHHRSEHWTISSGKPKITLNKKKFFKKINETIFIPKGSIHRIENNFRKPVKIMEVQLGTVLKETDIVRYSDIYGRVN